MLETPDVAAQLLITAKERTTESAEKLTPFVERALRLAEMSAIRMSRDADTTGLFVTVPMDDELTGMFLGRLGGVLPPFGELVPVRVAIHAGVLERGLPDQESQETLRRLVNAEQHIAPGGDALVVLVSDEFAAARSTKLEKFHPIAVDGRPAWMWTGGGSLVGNEILSLAITPNDRQTITGHADGAIRRWDIRTGAAVDNPLSQRHEGAVQALAVTPDGKQIISGGWDGIVWRWHATTGAPIQSHHPGNASQVTAVVVTPDGQEFISGGTDGRLHARNTTNGQRVRNGDGMQIGPVMAIAATPDGRHVVSADYDEIHRWDRDSGTLIMTEQTEHSGGITTLAVSPNGELLVSGGMEGTIRVSHLTTGRNYTIQTGHLTVQAIEVTPDSQRLISSGTDGSLRCWDLMTGEPIGVPMTGHQGAVFAIAVTPNGQLIVSGGADGVLRRWNARTGAPVDHDLAEQLAEVASDMESEHDSLGMSGDVHTVATVLAALSTKPPLSVALLGDWGAGKSSFMRQLRARVAQLSTSDTRLGAQTAFAGNVRQVSFNAWHYSDDHLWVGLIEHLFRELADKPDPGRIGELEARLASEQAERARVQHDLEATPVLRGIRHELRGWRVWLGVAFLLAGVAGVVFGRGVLAWVGATVALLGPAIAAWSGLRRHIATTRQQLLDRKTELEHDIRVTSAELAELDPARRLERLLTEITAEDRYASFRGLTGRIHHDLRRLSDDLAAARDRWDGTGSPPLQRIVLYVDDLDRCRPERVVEVLQAVNLLLTMDLFMVVVAVDPRWLLRSLRSHHGEDIRPVAYLDKIFHIPFALRPMGTRAADYLLSLLPPEPEPEPVEQAPEEPAPVTEAPEIPQPQPIRDSPPSHVDLAPPSAGPTAEGLRVTAAEREFLARLTPLLTTPRAIKKLTNLYRLLRLSVPPDELPDFLDGRYQAAAVLLATLAGEPTEIRAILTALAASQPTQDIVDTFRATESPLGPRLVDLILGIRKDLPVHTDTATYQAWAAEVARFGFETYDLYTC